MDPFLHNIDIGRIAGGQRNDPEMKYALKIGFLGHPPLGDDSSTEGQGADFKNSAVPEIEMLKSPNQYVPLPRMEGLAE